MAFQGIQIQWMMPLALILMFQKQKVKPNNKINHRT
jgi:hypothetical protein